MKLIAAAALGVFLSTSAAYAQAFSSGSTGADGALDVEALNCTSGPNAPRPGELGGCYVQLPESGVLNYTTIRVPATRRLLFRPNRSNSPVFLLATGGVLLGGRIDVNAYLNVAENRIDRARSGPGGFPGGYPGGFGTGPGGGTTTVAARWVGPLSLVPITGGSGGAISGGGGAIVIASGGKIELTSGGAVEAHAACAFGAGGTTFSIGSTGGGSGGAIRLVANQISIAANSGLYASGCSGGGMGMIRIETPPGGLSFQGGSSPSAVVSTINPAIAAAQNPDLQILSIAGFPVPQDAGTRKEVADLVLPKQLPDPIQVVVAASNIPVGSPVTVTYATTNQGTSPSVPLSGTLQNSTATIPVSGLNREQLAYLYVQVLFEAAALGVSGPALASADSISRVRVTSAIGGEPTFAFLRSDGTEISRERLPDTLKPWLSTGAN